MDSAVNRTDKKPSNGNSWFPTTKWPLLFTLQEGEETKEALNELCDAYWEPVYSVLKEKFSHEEAQDVAQSFFEHRVLRLKLFLLADPKKGQFRSLVQRALRWHVATHLRLNRYSPRRGAGARHIAWAEIPPEDLAALNRPANFTASISNGRGKHTVL